MWCEHCRQNVTGMLSETQDSVCCSRCGQALAAPIDEPAGSSTPVADAPGSPSSIPHPSSFILHPSTPPCPALPRSSLDSWALDEDLRHIERLLRRDAPRIDAPAWHAAPLSRAPGQTLSPPSPRRQPTSWWTVLAGALSWSLICVGLAATVCGIVLLIWTWLGGRPDLLIPGLACAAAGQFGLLGGFLIQPASPQDRPASSLELEHSDTQWLELHRHIGDILRADRPPGRGPGDPA